MLWKSKKKNVEKTKRASVIVRDADGRDSVDADAGHFVGTAGWGYRARRSRRQKRRCVSCAKRRV